MDEIQRIIVDVQNAEKLKLFNNDLKLEREQLTGLATDLRNGAISQAAFDAAAQKSATVIRDLNADIRELEKSSRTLSGSSMLQLQYVMDDLVNTSGDWSRHLASISNNIPGLVSSLGLGAGLAGTIGLISTGLIALAPVAKAAWDNLAGNAPEVADKVLKDIEQTIGKIHDQFVKLRDMPTSSEKESAFGVEHYLGRRPNAEMAAKGSAQLFTDAQVDASLSEKDRSDLAANQRELNVTEADIQRQMGFEEQRGVSPAERQQHERIIRQRIATAKSIREHILGGVRGRMGEALVAEAKTAGPAGNMARGHLARMARERPDLFPRAFASELDALNPDQLEADASASDEAAAAFDADNQAWRDRKKAAREDRKRRDKWNKESRKLEDIGQGNRIQQLAEQESIATHDKHVADLAAKHRQHEADVQAKKDAKELPTKLAAQDLRRFAGGMGMGLTDEQALQGAKDLLGMQAQQMSRQQATIEAFRHIIQRMQRMQMDAMRNGMGNDYTGQFSMMDPFGAGAG